MVGFGGYVAALVGDGVRMNYREKILSHLRYFYERPESVWIISLAAIIIGMPAAYYNFVHLPLAQERAAIEEEIHQVERSVQITEKFLREHHNEDLHEYINKLKRRRDRITTALPPSLELGKFLAALEKTAAEDNVTLLSIKPAETKKWQAAATDEQIPYGDRLTETSIDVSFSANYFSLLDFLRDLKKLDRLVNFSAITVKSDDKRLNCLLTLKIYSADFSAAKQ